MQEAVVEYAGQAIIATDMGKDFHSPNLLRQAIDADKLTAVIGSDGKNIPLEAASEHSLQYPPATAEHHRGSLFDGLAAPAQCETGPTWLPTLPVLSSESNLK